MFEDSLTSTTAIHPSAPAVTPAESGFESDDLSQTEKEHRQALEYLEPEEPGIVVEEVREADVRIPNIPVPKSSDGDVCNIVSLSCLYAKSCISTALGDQNANLCKNGFETFSSGYVHWARARRG